MACRRGPSLGARDTRSTPDGLRGVVEVRTPSVFSPIAVDWNTEPLIRRTYARALARLHLNVGHRPARDHNFIVLDLLRDKLNCPSNRLFELVEKWKPLLVGYEENGMQADIQHLGTFNMSETLASG